MLSGRKVASLDDDPSLPFFWTDCFLESNRPRLVAIDSAGHRTLVSASDEGLASGLIGPFGGPWREPEASEGLDVHLAEIKRFARQIASRRFVIRFPPPFGDFHDVPGPETIGLTFRGRPLHNEIDHVLEIGRDHHMMYNRNRRRDLVAGIADGFKALVGPSQLSPAVNVIAANRSRQGVALTASLRLLQEWQECLGPNLLIVCVTDRSGTAIAGGVGLKLTKETGYVLQWGHVAQPESRSSPMTLLAHTLFQEFLSSGISKVLLGSSSVDGALNPGLARFKESLGASPLKKPVWEYDL